MSDDSKYNVPQFMPITMISPSTWSSNPQNSVVPFSERVFAVNRFADLGLRVPVRGYTTQWTNKREDFESDLESLRKKMYPLYEKKPDLDKLDITKIVMPKGLKIKLMDHQIRALLWLEWREKSFLKGAILGNIFIIYMC